MSYKWMIEQLFYDVPAQHEYLHYDAVLNEQVTVEASLLMVHMDFIHSKKHETQLTNRLPTIAAVIFKSGMYEDKKLQVLQQYIAKDYIYSENSHSPYVLVSKKKADVTIDGREIRVVPLQPSHKMFAYTLYIKKALKSIVRNQLRNDLYMLFVVKQS